jgi:hypothetical protein
VIGYTVRERYDRGEFPLTAEEERLFAEYDAASFRAPASEDAYPDFAARLGPVGDPEGDASSSDADRAYADQLRIFGGHTAAAS